MNNHALTSFPRPLDRQNPPHWIIFVPYIPLLFPTSTGNLPLLFFCTLYLIRYIHANPIRVSRGISDFFHPSSYWRDIVLAWGYIGVGSP